jgi:Ca2+-binding RTX toxin-like protein
MVDLQTGFATGVGGSVSGIATIFGGSGTPAASGVFNLLIGNGGNTLYGGLGRRNILVAGASASTLNGGDGEDLLIGGSTGYDTEASVTTWLQIAAYWAGSDDYATRIANLMSGISVPLLDASVVTGNGGNNTLTGNGALALLYTDGLDTLSGFDPGSQQIVITP